MKLRVTCSNPDCGKSATVPDEFLGKSVRCRSCSTSVLVGGATTTTDDGLPLGDTVGGEPTPAKAKPSAPVVAKPVSPNGSKPVAAPNRPTQGREKLGRFELRAELGAGAFGRVYRAYDPQLDREVALKVPHPSVLEHPQRVERFLREARAAAQLRHPNLVPVFESGTADGRPYIAAAFITGKPLDRALEDRCPDPREAAETVRKLAEGLAYAHTQGIVHRDVKPANVLIDEAGQPLLTDFGLASRLDEGSRVTSDGTVMGTPAYMAPEQAAGQQGEARPSADQYSLGVTLYELLTGRTPFEGPAAVVIHNQIHGTPEPPRKMDRAIPRDLETICLKAMAKRPRDRYADCQAMADDLRRWLDGQPIFARRLGLVERTVRWVKREPVLAGAVGVVLALFAVIGVILTLRTIELVDRLQVVEHDRDAGSARADIAEKATAEVKKEFELVMLDRDDERVAIAAMGGDGAEKLLDDVPANRRGVDWRLAAMKLARAPDYGRPLNRLPTPQGGMADITFPAGGGGLLIGLGDGRTLTQWDVWTGVTKKFGKLDGKLPPIPAPQQFGPAGPNRDVLVSGDGKRVVVVKANGGPKDQAGKEPPLSIIVEVFDVATGNRISGWTLDECFWPTAAVTVDGSKVALAYAMAGKPHELGVWDATTGTRIPAMTQPLAPVPFKGVVLAFSPRGTEVAATTARDKGEIRAWTVPTGTEVIHVPDIGIVSQLAFAPDGQRIAAVGGAEVRRNDGPAVAWQREVPVTTKQAVPVTKYVEYDEKVKKTLKATDGKDCEVEYVVKVTKSETVSEPRDVTTYVVQSAERQGPWVEPSVITVPTTSTAYREVKKLVYEQVAKTVERMGTRTADGKVETCKCQDTVTVNVAKEVTVKEPFTTCNMTIRRLNANLLRIWDRPDNKLTFRVEEDAPIEAIAWRGDGRRIASAAAGNSVKQSTCTLPDPLKCAADDPTATLVKVWHSGTAKLLHTLDREGRLGVTCLAWSDDGVHLAAGFRRHPDFDNKANAPDVVCWSAESKQLIASRFEHEGPVYDLAFSPDNAVLASFGKCSDKVRLWDGETGNALRQLGPASAFTRFGAAQYVITGGPRPPEQFFAHGYQLPPTIWNRQTGELVLWPKTNLLAASDTPAGVVALVSPWPAPQEAGKPAAAPAPPEVRDVATGKVICTLAGASDTYQNRWAITSDGKRVLVLVQLPPTGPPGQWQTPIFNLEAWDAATGKSAYRRGDVLNASASGSRLAVVVAKPKPAVVILNAADGTEVASMPLADGDLNGIQAVQLLGTDRVLVHQQAFVRVFDPAGGKQVLSQVSQPGLWSASPDGKVVAVMTGQPVFRPNQFGQMPIEDGEIRDPKIHLFDSASGSKLPEVKVQARYVTEIVFSPDGTRLAYCGHGGRDLTDGVIDLIEVATGERIAAYRGHVRTVKRVAFRPDGKMLASGGTDRSVRLWRLPPTKAEAIPDDPPDALYGPYPTTAPSYPSSPYPPPVMMPGGPIVPAPVAPPTFPAPQPPTAPIPAPVPIPPVPMPPMPKVDVPLPKPKLPEPKAKPKPPLVPGLAWVRGDGVLAFEMGEDRSWKAMSNGDRAKAVEYTVASETPEHVEFAEKLGVRLRLTPDELQLRRIGGEWKAVAKGSWLSKGDARPAAGAGTKHPAIADGKVFVTKDSYAKENDRATWLERRPDGIWTFRNRTSAGPIRTFVESRVDANRLELVDCRNGLSYSAGTGTFGCVATGIENPNALGGEWAGKDTLAAAPRPALTPPRTPAEATKYIEQLGGSAYRDKDGTSVTVMYRPCGDELVAAAVLFPDLKSFYCYDVNVTADGLRRLVACKALKSISVQLCRWIDDDAVAAIAECRGLETLMMEGNSITAAAYRQLAKLPALATLILHEPPQSRDAFAAIGDCRKLKTLNVSNASRITDVHLKELGRLTALEEFTIHAFQTPVTGAFLADWGQLTNLKRLELPFQQLKPESLAGVKAFPALEDLTIPAGAATAEGMKPLLELRTLTGLTVMGEIRKQKDQKFDLTPVARLTGLRRLSVHSVNLTADEAKKLAGLPNLANLSCRGSRGLTTDAVKAFAAVPKLTTVDLTYTDATDAAVAELLAVPTVAELKLVGCKELTAPALKAALRTAAAPKLAVTTPTGLLTAEDMAALRKDKPGLRLNGR